MSRRRARDLAFKALYAAEFGGAPATAALEGLLAAAPDLGGEEAFARRLLQITLEHRGDADALLTRYSPDWPVERMLSTDRNILRLAVCELLYDRETPPAVVISEAVEMAKRYGDENSGRFVNGILGELLRRQVGA